MMSLFRGMGLFNVKNHVVRRSLKSISTLDNIDMDSFDMFNVANIKFLQCIDNFFYLVCESYLSCDIVTVIFISMYNV